MKREKFCKKRWNELKKSYSDKAKINYNETKQFELDDLDEELEYNNSYIYAYLGFIEEAVGNLSQAKEYYEKSRVLFKNTCRDDHIHIVSVNKFLHKLNNLLFMTEQEKIQCDLLILNRVLKDYLFSIESFGINSDCCFFNDHLYPEKLSICKFVIDNKKHLTIGIGTEDWYGMVPNVINEIELFMGNNQRFKITNKLIWFIKHALRWRDDKFNMSSRKQILKTLKQR